MSAMHDDQGGGSGDGGRAEIEVRRRSPAAATGRGARLLRFASYQALALGGVTLAIIAAVLYRLMMPV